MGNRKGSKINWRDLLIGAGGGGLLALLGVIMGTAPEIYIVLTLAFIGVCFSVPIISSRRNIVWVFVLAAVLSFLGWLFWPRVTLGTQKLVFNASVPHENYLVSLKNNKSNDVYAVQLKMLLSRTTTFEDYSFTLPINSRRPIIDESPVADVSAVACRDANGQEFWLFSIYRMTPQENREISVTLNRSSRASIQLAIPAYKNEPIPRIDNPHKMYSEYTPPENQVNCGTDKESAILFWLTNGHKIPASNLSSDYHVKHGTTE